MAERQDDFYNFAMELENIPIDASESEDLYSTLQTESVSSSRQVHIEGSLDSFQDVGHCSSLHRGGNKTLNLFSDSRNRHPKKEYVRCKLIRGHKRANRQIETNKLPSKTLNRFRIDHSPSIVAWQQLAKSYWNNRKILNSTSRTESGPLTDGKKKRNRVDASIQKSFNDDFCREYFGCLPILDSFQKYIELIFAEDDPNILCEKLDFMCCGCDGHLSECYSKWDTLKSYLKFGMIEDLGISLKSEDIDQFLA